MGDGMRRRIARWAAIGAGLLALMANSAQSAYACAKATDAAALRTRMLQTELMVAALSCNQKEDYNTFVTHYRPQLKQNGTALKRYFDRSYGRRSAQELNTFTTRLANEASKRSLSDIGKFCTDAKAVFAALRTMPTVQFTAFVAERPTADAHGMDVCETPVVKKASLKEEKRTTTSSRANAGTTKTAKAESARKTKTASAKSGAATTKKASAGTKAASKKASSKSALTTAELNKAQLAKTPATTATTQSKLTETAQSGAK